MDTEVAAAQQQPVKLTGESKWGATVWLPCDLTLDLPVPGFRVCDLLRLKSSDLIDTRWSQGKDMPLRANGKLIAWAEFEVVGDKLAIRLTELA